MELNEVTSHLLIPFHPIDPLTSGFIGLIWSEELKAYEEPAGAHQKPSAGSQRSINISLMAQLMTQEFQGGIQGNICSFK